jgi:hypothetical protein
MALRQLLGNIIAKRHANTRHFKGMCQTVVYEDTTREWEDLGFVLQTTERGRKDQTVVIAFELCTIVMTLGVAMLLSETFIGNKLLPIHHNQSAKVLK